MFCGKILHNSRENNKVIYFTHENNFKFVSMSNYLPCLPYSIYIYISDLITSLVKKGYTVEKSNYSVMA